MPASPTRAQMAELVDALASGASVRMDVEVRVLFWAPKIRQLPLKISGLEVCTADLSPNLSPKEFAAIAYKQPPVAKFGVHPPAPCCIIKSRFLFARYELSAE